ncbi:hypothetical protein EVAR_17139_1 [Eumeta japonica]|uniref:Mariner Mos1 transposase n=1 Tax=Eumeta variegata TaxID=151549 RepID=A0A4C1UMW8_EUMVA|nr:hypothetical protein EVAR_17139_1 [Eumeta japonica]
MTYQQIRTSLGIDMRHGTNDESWIYCYDPETKNQPAQWVLSFEELPTKVKRGQSVEKKMVASFFGIKRHCVATVLEDKNNYCRLVF